MTELLEDLRFLIGSFFLIVGLVLLYEGSARPTLVEGWNLDLVVGAGFSLFAFAALGLAVSARGAAEP